MLKKSTKKKTLNSESSKKKVRESTLKVKNNHEIKLKTGAVMRIEVLSSRIFRLRMNSQGAFKEPSLIRYGIVRSDWPSVKFKIEEMPTSLVLRTVECALKIDKRNGMFTLRGQDGRMLVSSAQAPWSNTDEGFGAEFSLSDNEHLYGLGDVARDRLDKRGFRARMWVTNVKSYIPIPVLISDNNWGLFVNTTWNHYFDVGHSQSDRLRFWGECGELDFYLIAGESLTSLVDGITEITGKPSLLPLWAYGLTFVCNEKANARDMIDDCLNLRRAGIPCDLIGLEPGWMSKLYDFSTEKDWHPERFYIPSWIRNKDDVSSGNNSSFMGAAQRLGFKVSLWLCENYDVSYEEERQAGNINAGKVGTSSHKHNVDDFELDEHFTKSVRIDQITKPEEPWFEHLKKFVDDGAEAFKLDGCEQVNEHPDRKWGNGMDDQEMHNLYPVILNKQMARGFAEHTGRRPMIYSSGGYTGIQRYSASWAGDTGGGAKPLASMLNLGLSGHANTSCDMDSFSPAGIHCGFLQPWSQLCSWAYWRHPWLLGDKLLPIFKYYAKLRYRLIPYLYSAAHQAHRTGMPIMRAMPLVCPDDPKAGQLLHQYMLGDFLLVAAFTDKVHIPSGAWFDFWSGRRIEGPADIVCEIPPDRGGPLLVKSGAILPHWPEMDYVGQKSVGRIEIRVYPSDKTSSYIMYEDDGNSLRYCDGEVAVTTYTCERRAGKVTLTISSRLGRYEGMPDRREFDVWIKTAVQPSSVKVCNSSVPWDFDSVGGWIHLVAVEDSERKQPVIISFCI